MAEIEVTNSFKILVKGTLDEQKRHKLKALKDNTYSIIVEKYPIYKQLNNAKNPTMLTEINAIRSACNRIEAKIEACQTEEALSIIAIDDNALRRIYGMRN